MGQVPFIVGFLSLPILVGVAILKYCLYEIDVVIKKTVTLAILVGLYGDRSRAGDRARRLPLVNPVRDRPEVTLMAGVVLGLPIIPLYRLSRRIADRLSLSRPSHPVRGPSKFRRAIERDLFERRRAAPDGSRARGGQRRIPCAVWVRG